MAGCEDYAPIFVSIFVADIFYVWYLNKKSYNYLLCYNKPNNSPTTKHILIIIWRDKNVATNAEKNILKP